MMSQPVENSSPVTSTVELQAALEQALSSHFGESCKITKLERRPAANQSSFALEELVLCVNDEIELEVMFKDLSWSALLDNARQGKPDFLYNPLREIKTYEEILSRPNGSSAEFVGAVCYGTVVEQASSRYWLFLEKVPGMELYQVGFDVWEEAARWLALLHTRFAQQRELFSLAQLLIYDGDFYRRWLYRAYEFVWEREEYTEDARQQMKWLAERYEQVIERLLALPVTFIHGEFYASNVLVQETTDGWRVCPVDWEMAAIGPGLLDVAALVSGTWTEKEKTALALSYYRALGSESAWASEEEFLAALDCCRLHVAVQWLGWSSNWMPPSEHAQDWLDEAFHMAKKLEL